MSKTVANMSLPRESIEKSALVQLLGIKWLLEGGLTFRLAVTILGSINLVFALLMIANVIFDAWPARVRKLSLDRQCASHSWGLSVFV